jgi:hypothetical protein
MKPKERTKMFSTVWTVFTWLFLFVAVFGEHTATILIVMAGLGIMTLLATFMIMNAEKTTQPTPLKAKREEYPSIDWLIESMSDADMERLRKRLMSIGDDGEIVTLAELQDNHRTYSE